MACGHSGHIHFRRSPKCPPKIFEVRLFPAALRTFFPCMTLCAKIAVKILNPIGRITIIFLLKAVVNCDKRLLY
jgi:hypothetical protein